MSEEQKNEDQIIEERKKKALNYIKNNKQWISYIFLAVIVWMAVHIRKLNLSGLKDITTGGWTLGPDLDPFLFLRWMKDIVAQGTLYAVDTMRYAPIGFNTTEELLLHPYMMVWFHKILSIFGNPSVEYSAVIYPVFMFALTVIAFFFFVRKVFVNSMGETKANIIALISSFFLSVIPSLLPRTIAGIPEKESVGFLFLFLSFYFFLLAWDAKKMYSTIILSFLAGISTTAMNLVWGGSVVLFYTIAIFLLIAFLIGKMNTNKIILGVIWILSSIVFTRIFTTRFSLMTLSTSTYTLVAFLALASAVIYLIIQKTKIKQYFEKGFISRIPKPVQALVAVLIIGLVLSTVFFGFSFITFKVKQIERNLIKPVTDRLGVTVAENKQSYLSEWSQSFGPNIKNQPIFFWLFFIGSISLFYYLLKDSSTGEKTILTLSYLIFLFCFTFSKYSESSALNGTNAFSKGLVLIGFIIIIFAFGYYYNKHHKENTPDKFKELDSGILLLLIFFFFSIVAAKGAVRLIMVLVPAASMIVSFMLIYLTSVPAKVKDDLGKMILWIVALIVIILAVYAGVQFYKISGDTAKQYVPSVYTNQWQYAMSWVRDNTPQNAIFAHWWDYGYWVQSMGERATVTDGGNAIPYWNHLMGRHALTGRSDMESLEFLYSHNVTHFLIDSTDIGKYGAFSSIGSDIGYDRRSYITYFGRQTSQESKNTTKVLYTGEFGLDQDLAYNDENISVILPEGRAGLGGILLNLDKNGSLVSAPRGIFVYQQNTNSAPKQYELPFRYAYYNNKMIDFNSGIEAGIFAVPSFNAQTGKIDRNAVLLYLSNKTVQTQLARLYLYNENDPYFNLAHTEDDLLVKQLKEANLLNSNEDFVFYQGLRGPIRIWKVSYPEGMKVNPEYTQTSFTTNDLQIA